MLSFYNSVHHIAQLDSLCAQHLLAIIQCIWTASPPLSLTLVHTIDAIPLRLPVIAGAKFLVTLQSLSHFSPVFLTASDTASKTSLPVVVPFRLISSSPSVQEKLSTPRKKNQLRGVCGISALIACNRVKSTSFVFQDRLTLNSCTFSGHIVSVTFMSHCFMNSPSGLPCWAISLATS